MLDKFLYIISWAFLFKLIYGFSDAISLGEIPKIQVRYQGGNCQLVNGHVSLKMRNDIADTLKGAGVSKAAIRQMKDGSFRFSRSVPERIRQRLRNMIVAG